jgi:hypothetical protein
MPTWVAPTRTSTPARMSAVVTVMRGNVVRVAYKVTTAAGVPAVNVVTGSRVVNRAAVITGNRAGARRKVRVSATGNERVWGAASKGVAASAEVSTTTAAAKVRPTTAAAKVRPATAAAAEVTTTTSAAVSAAPTTATVALSSGRHRSPGRDHQGRQYTEAPGKNTYMFRRHGLHSVAGLLKEPARHFATCKTLDAVLPPSFKFASVQPVYGCSRSSFPAGG